MSSFFSSISFSSISSPSFISSSSSQPKEVEIEYGDTIESISVQYKVSIDTICQLNSINPSTKLSVGKYIRLRGNLSQKSNDKSAEGKIKNNSSVWDSEHSQEKSTISSTLLSTSSDRSSKVSSYTSSLYQYFFDTQNTIVDNSSKSDQNIESIIIEKDKNIDISDDVYECAETIGNNDDKVSSSSSSSSSSSGSYLPQLCSIPDSVPIQSTTTTTTTTTTTPTTTTTTILTPNRAIYILPYLPIYLQQEPWCMLYSLYHHGSDMRYIYIVITLYCVL